MATTGVPGIPLAAIAAGGVLAWSGIYNRTVTETLTSLLHGVQPTPGPKEQLIASTDSTGSTSPPGGSTAPPGDTGAATQTAAHNQNIARLLAAPYGWSTGQEWEDLVSLWNRESGWSNTAENPVSGAYGIAQALGHGPTNQYPAGPANPPTSSASAQISWGLQYIKDRYGDPIAAWAHEQSAGWY